MGLLDLTLSIYMTGKSNRQALIFSFFAGAGFLDLGFEKSGFKSAFVNELNKSFLSAYKYARVKMKLPKPIYGYYEGDMADLINGNKGKVLAKNIREAHDQHKLVGFIGGPPCPDFSVAGKNLGRNGLRGKLSSTYVTLISHHKPDFFLFENVKGLWITKSHREFYEELKNKLKHDGYVLTERLINSLEYGVPQDRDRIILVGFKKQLIPTKLLAPHDKSMLIPDAFPWSDFIKYSRESIFAKYKQAQDLYSKPMVRKPMHIPIDTTVEYWFKKNSVTTHPNSKHHFKPRQAKLRIEKVVEGDVTGKSFKRLHRWRYSPTVAYGNNEVHLHPYKHRRISVSEAFALQSLPKAYSFPDTMTLSNMFKAISNGVPYMAAKGIAGSVKKFISNL